MFKNNSLQISDSASLTSEFELLKSLQKKEDQKLVLSSKL